MTSKGSAPTPKPEFPLSTFAFLFAEIVHYHQSQVSSDEELEERLHQAGVPVGMKYLELIAFRQGPKATKRELLGNNTPVNHAVSVLQFVYSVMWKSLFKRTATGLVKGPDDDNREIYLLDNDPITNKFISTGSGGGSSGGGGPNGDGNDIQANEGPHCGAFLAGLIQGAMLAMGVDCTVTASWDQTHTQTVFVVKVLGK
jgi:hypothetical protein